MPEVDGVGTGSEEGGDAGDLLFGVNRGDSGNGYEGAGGEVKEREAEGVGEGVFGPGAERGKEAENACKEKAALVPGRALDERAVVEVEQIGEQHAEEERVEPEVGGEVIPVEIERVGRGERASAGETRDAGANECAGDPPKGVGAVPGEFRGENHGGGDGEIKMLFDADGPEMRPVFKIVGIVVLHEHAVCGGLAESWGLFPKEQGERDGGEKIEKVGGVYFEPAAEEEATGIEAVIALEFPEEKTGDEETGEDEEDVGADGGAAPRLSKAEDDARPVVREWHQVPTEDEQDGAGTKNIKRRQPARGNGTAALISIHTAKTTGTWQAPQAENRSIGISSVTSTIRHMITTLRRMSDDELPTVLSTLTASGGTSRSVESWRQDRMTALVLGEKGSVSAVMPMARRTVAVAPGRTIEAGWLSSNQFASRMGLRRQTRETAGQWAELLPDLDALLVIRRDEGSLAGRWYGQTGFHEVLSIRCLYLDMESPPEGGTAGQSGRYRVEVVNAGKGRGPEGMQWDAGKWQPEMLAVYREIYAACGGTPVRSENFWAPALAHHYYGQHYQFQIVGLWGGDAGAAALMGYAVIGWSGWHSKRPRMDILEFATRQWDTLAASELLRTTAQLAWSKSVRQVRAVISAHDPYRSHLTRSGFIDRWGYVMLAKWLQPQRYLDRVATTLPAELGALSLRLSSPGEMPLRMEVRGSGGAVFSLQGDGRTVTRLLLDRLDVAGALHGGDGTLFAAESGAAVPDGARLALAFPWTPWVFHMIDYI